MSMQLEIAVTRADRVLVWLKILTLFLGGIATLAVVFLADVMTARLANPIGVAGVEEVAMSEESELHHWLGYKVALAAQDDVHVVYHVQKAFALATDPKQKSVLDGVLVEHMPAGHFIHTKNILKELLGTKSEPASSSSLTQLEARLALGLIKKNKAAEAGEQVQHLVTVTTSPTKETAQEVLEAITRGNVEAATRLLTELSGGGR
ncbi:MAG: hypothetical protein HY664_05510 [Chloroflexi bacterium]|nr:hypothetical protein [Chloroflexota bacterium]